MWRKKVDATLLKDGETPIPAWVCQIWDIEKLFGTVRSKKDNQAEVDVRFKGKVYSGFVTKRKRQKGFGFRLSFNQSLTDELSDTFVMTYMRAIEAEISTDKNHNQIEDEISFWELLDMEFDYKSKMFLLTAHYTVKPQFPELFKKLISSAPLKVVRQKAFDETKISIQKQDWQPRDLYRTEVGAENVIYTLIDTKKKLLYVGETVNLVKRFNEGHADIKDWDHYKYSVLPPELAGFRVDIERMLIRDMAAILSNKQNIPAIQISDYKLANRKIDK